MKKEMISYAETVKKDLLVTGKTLYKPSQRLNTAESDNYIPKNTVIIRNISDREITKDSTTLVRVLTILFPDITVVKSIVSQKGAIATFQLGSAEMATHVCNNWKPVSFGGKTACRIPQEENTFAVIKNVDTNVSDEEVANILAVASLGEITYCRRMIRNERKMNLVKIRFKNPEDQMKVISENRSVKIADINCRLEASYSRGPRIRRCYKC